MASADQAQFIIDLFDLLCVCMGGNVVLHICKSQACIGFFINLRSYLAGVYRWRPVDIVLNIYSVESILEQLGAMKDRPQINVMIHEQYFYPDYRDYQPEFAQKLEPTFAWLRDYGYQSRFLKECI